MALRLIGAGFGRTGTMSIKLALERIGFGPCYHMKEVMENPPAVAYWGRLARGESVDWDEVFAGYVATVDWPACTYWRELAEYYPDAKVLLSIREPESWFESTQKTILSPEHLGWFLNNESNPDARDMVYRLFNKTFDDRGNQRDHAIEVFNRHNQEVMRGISHSRLLVFNVAEGWAPLCDFLNVAAPDEPFPNVNSTDEWLASRVQ